MTKMIDYCRSRGTRLMVGQVLRDNRRMRDFVASLGFAERDIDDEPDVVSVVLDLEDQPVIVGAP